MRAQTRADDKAQNGARNKTDEMHQPEQDGA